MRPKERKVFSVAPDTELLVRAATLLGDNPIVLAVASQFQLLSFIGGRPVAISLTGFLQDFSMGERLWRALEYVLPEGFVLGRYFGDLNSLATGLDVLVADVTIGVSVVV